MATLSSDLALSERERIARGYLDRCHAAFADAVGAAGEEVDLDLRIADSTLRLRFAGDALRAPLSSAFRHLEIDAEPEPDLELALWDTESTGVALPRIPWQPHDFGPLGRVHGYESTGVVPLLDPSYRALALVDVDGGRAVYCAPAVEAIPWYEHAAPLRSLLHLLLGRRGIRLVHGAAVARDGRGALLGGKGGSGKSTLALSCLAAGLEYLGDDYVAITTDGIPAVHSLYGTAKVAPESLRLVPGFDPAIANPDHDEDEKTILDLHRYPGDLLRASASVAAVVVPTLGGDGSGPRHASAREALLALAPTTVLQLPGQDREALAVAAEIVRQAPAYSLEVGSPAAAASAIDQLLDDGR